MDNTCSKLLVFGFWTGVLLQMNSATVYGFAISALHSFMEFEPGGYFHRPPEGFHRRSPVPFNQGDRGECGGSFSLQPHEPITIQSPNFPFSYPPDANCVWKFQAPFGVKIDVKFSDFLLQTGSSQFLCDNDYVEIKDWTGSTRFCSYGPYTSVVSVASSWLEIKFVSDTLWQFAGFQATVLLEPNAGCGKSWVPPATSGVLASPSYPFPYPHDTVCGWVIQVAPGRRVRLDCTDLFYLAGDSKGCGQDFLAISVVGDVMMHDAERSCGHDGPGVVMSERNKMTVLFRSDKWTTGTGVRCRFTSFPSEVELAKPTSKPVRPTLEKPTAAASAPQRLVSAPVCECGHVAKRFPRIIGGNRTTIDENPWMVSITDIAGNHLCGGALVKYRYVVTAGHCVYGWKPEFSRVLLGSDIVNNETDPSSLVAVRRISVYPGYKKHFNDLALLELDTYDVAEHPDVHPICLPPPNMTFEDEIAKVVGWNRQGAIEDSRQHLHQVEVPVLPHSECLKAYGNQTITPEQMMCAGSAEKDACEGDSGGPLIWESEGSWHLIGIVSFGLGCGLPGFPGVYVRVNHFLDWLREKVVTSGSGNSC